MIDSSDPAGPAPANSVARDGAEETQPAPAPAVAATELPRLLQIVAIWLGLVIFVSVLAIPRLTARRGVYWESSAANSSAAGTHGAAIDALAVEPLRVKRSGAWPIPRTRKDTPFPRAFDEATKPYLAGDYAIAVQQMRDLSARYPTAPEPLVYAGVSELLAGNASAAIDLLNLAAPMAGETFGEDVLWYLALAHHAKGESAMTQLRAVCAVGGEHGPHACAAIREIESRERGARD